MEDRTQKAFDFAAEATKQIITLSTAMVGLTVIFLKDVLGQSATYGWPLRVAWLLYVVAIAAGLWSLLALTGLLGDKTISDAQLSIYRSSATIPMMLQLASFFAAVVFTVVFGWHQL